MDEYPSAHLVVTSEIVFVLSNFIGGGSCFGGMNSIPPSLGTACVMLMFLPILGQSCVSSSSLAVHPLRHMIAVLMALHCLLFASEIGFCEFLS